MLIVLAGLALGGLWLGLQLRQPDGPSTVSESAAAGPTVVKLFKTPENVPAFSMTDVDGRTYTSDGWRGKVVLVNFWATWCTPCRAEIPDLVKLQDKYRDQLVIVGVSEDEIPVDEVKRFAAGYGVNYPIVMVTPELKKLFRGVAALPTTFVLDREGRLAQRHVGILDPVHTENETRVLAGLDVTATVEYIEHSDTVRVMNAAEAKKLPGIDLVGLSETQKQAAMHALLTEDCTCGCGLTLAVCRLDDPTCPVSLPLAQEVVKKYSAAR